MLQETLADFEVRATVAAHRSGCIKSLSGVHSCVQAAAAARVAGGPDIWVSACFGDGASVLCHVIADADAVNKPDSG